MDADWERWCRFAEHDQSVRARVLQVYLAVLKSLMLVNVAYIGGVVGYVKVFGSHGLLVFGMITAFLSITFSFAGCVPGIDCLHGQRRHIWFMYENNQEKSDEQWRQVLRSEVWVGRFQIVSIILMLTSLFLFILGAFIIH